MSLFSCAVVSLLNLGADFNLDKDNWSILSIRIEDIVKQRESLFEALRIN